MLADVLWRIRSQCKRMVFHAKRPRFALAVLHGEHIFNLSHMLWKKGSIHTSFVVNILATTNGGMYMNMHHKKISLFIILLLIPLMFTAKPALADKETYYLSNAYGTRYICLRPEYYMEIDEDETGIYSSGTEVELLEYDRVLNAVGQNTLIFHVRIGIREGWVLGSELSCKRDGAWKPRKAFIMAQEHNATLYRSFEGYNGIDPIGVYPDETAIEIIGFFGSWTHVFVDGNEGYITRISHTNDLSYEGFRGRNEIFRWSISAFKGSVEFDFWSYAERELVYEYFDDVQMYKYWDMAQASRECEECQSAITFYIEAMAKEAIENTFKEDAPYANRMRTKAFFFEDEDGWHIWQFLRWNANEWYRVWIDAHTGEVILCTKGVNRFRALVRD